MNETNYKPSYVLPLSIVMAGIIIAGGIYIDGDGKIISSKVKMASATIIDGGFLLPLEYEEKILEKMVSLGVIDPAKMSRVTELNLLWAFGLANKNRVLEEGPMMDQRYGGPHRMASVGGWSVARGNAMDHYSMHSLLPLSTDEQELVERVSKSVFRPCCKNSAYFPDCNHGMAMLAFLEILATQGAEEETLKTAADNANSDWFEPREREKGNCST
ncbi:MAG: hypothetical protein NUV78_02740 [Candidatus Zambryskibacteria bacterium]|nr:hypothetical protein [Candidatus Zambryskibacteria bacterium]